MHSDWLERTYRALTHGEPPAADIPQRERTRQMSAGVVRALSRQLLLTGTLPPYQTFTPMGGYLKRAAKAVDDVYVDRLRRAASLDRSFALAAFRRLVEADVGLTQHEHDKMAAAVGFQVAAAGDGDIRDEVRTAAARFTERVLACQPDQITDVDYWLVCDVVRRHARRLIADADLEARIPVLPVVHPAPPGWRPFAQPRILAPVQAMSFAKAVATLGRENPGHLYAQLAARHAAAAQAAIQRGGDARDQLVEAAAALRKALVSVSPTNRHPFIALVEQPLRALLAAEGLADELRRALESVVMVIDATPPDRRCREFRQGRGIMSYVHTDPLTQVDLYAHMGRQARRVFGSAALADIRSPDPEQTAKRALQEMAKRDAEIGLVPQATHWGELTVRSVLDGSPGRYDPVEVAAQVNGVLLRHVPQLEGQIGITAQPYEAQLMRAYFGQQGFKNGMAISLAPLAWLPGSGIPGDHHELGRELHKAALAKLESMWSTDGLGETLHRRVREMEPAAARTVDLEVLRYAVASTVASFARRAAENAGPEALAASRSAMAALEATAAKAAVHAMDLYRAAGLKAPEIAKVGMHPSASLCDDLVAAAAQTAADVAKRANMTPEAQLAALAPYEGMMVVFSMPEKRLGDLENHAAFREIVSGLRREIGGPAVSAPLVGRLPGAYGAGADAAHQAGHRRPGARPRGGCAGSGGRAARVGAGGGRCAGPGG